MKEMEVDASFEKMFRIAKQSVKNRKDVMGMGVFEIDLVNCA